MTQDTDTLSAILPLYHCTDCGWLSTRRKSYIRTTDGKLVCLDCARDLVTRGAMRAFLDDLEAKP